MSRLLANLALNFQRLDKLDQRRMEVWQEIERGCRQLADERGMAFIRPDAVRKEIEDA